MFTLRSLCHPVVSDVRLHIDFHFCIPENSWLAEMLVSVPLCVFT